MTLASNNLQQCELYPVEIITGARALEAYPQLSEAAWGPYFVRPAPPNTARKELQKLLSLPSTDLGSFQVPHSSKWAVTALRDKVSRFARSNSYCNAQIRKLRPYECWARLAIRELKIIAQRSIGLSQIEWESLIFAEPGLISPTYRWYESEPEQSYAGLHFDDNSMDFLDDCEVLRIIFNLRTQPRTFVIVPWSIHQLALSLGPLQPLTRDVIERHALLRLRYALAIEIPPGSAIYCKTRKYLHDGLCAHYELPDIAGFYCGYQ